LDLRGRKWREVGEDYIMRNFIIFTHHQNIRMMKSRRMRWAMNVARMGEMRNAYKILFGKPEAKDATQKI
jgi:hypothetical protein